MRMIEKTKYYGCDFKGMKMALNIHQKIIIAVVAAVFILSMYDVLFHLLLGILHILFEAAEWVLDHLIEHLFETGMRETQIIVFYILMMIISGSIYKLYRQLPRWYHKLEQKLYQKTVETLAQWRAVSIIGRIAWWSFFITAVNCWLFLI